ncbi:MAG: diguanylate cyclase [Arenimonas sp.]
MGRNRFLRLCAWILAIGFAGVAMAADGVAGTPPVLRFAPDIEVHPRNFAVAQGPDGIVYVGNQEGVLEFDGESWRLLRLPNEDIVRSLLAAPDGNIYVGGYNSFGVLQRDANGALTYRDLTTAFKKALNEREFADIWDIVATPEGVYFRAVSDVFAWDPKGGAPRHWHHDGRFGAIVHHGGQTLLQFRGEGFKKRDGDHWTEVPGSAPLVNLVYGLLPLADGGLLTRGVDGGWWRLGDGKLEPVAMPPGMPASSQFESALRLDDGTLAFASRDGLLYLVAPDRNSELHFKIAPGFITDVARGIDGGILATSEQTIHRVAWPAPWNVLGSEHGADGSLYAVSDWEGQRYLLTSSGVRRATHTEGGSMVFSPLPWEPLSSYDLIGIAPGRAMLARAHKLVVVDNGVLHDVSAELVYPRMFRRSRFDPARIFVGTENGLRLVTVRGGQPSLSPALGEGEAMRVNSVAEVAPGEAWAGSDRHGLWRYQLAADGTLKSRERAGTAQGLRLGKIPEAHVERMADGSLVASTREGWFRLEGAKFVEMKLGDLSTKRKPGELLRLVESPTGELWAYGVTRIFHRGSDKTWHEQDVASFRRGAIVEHRFEADGRAMFIAGQSLLLHEAGAPDRAAVAPQVQMRAVTLMQVDGSQKRLPLTASKAVRLPPGDSGIRFEFALPELGRADTQLYRGRLVGYENRFSDWARSHRYTYSRLRAGNYRLEVEAMDSLGRVSRLEPFAIVSAPRWYTTLGVRVMGVLVLVLVLGLLTQAYVAQRTMRLAQQKRTLEDTVARRTSELADANRRLEMMANIDGLTGIPNRRRLDEYMAAVWVQCGERGRPLSLLAIDVDRFKEFNDREGHLAGDQLLRLIVERLAHCLRRAEDLLARYGGEEFLVVLPGADLPIAAQLAEVMRKEVEKSGLGATVSIGVASRVPDDSAVLTELIARADAALYVAKKGGRNRIEIAGATRPKTSPA